MNYYKPDIEEFFVGFEYEEYTAGFEYDVKFLEAGVTGGSMSLQVLNEPKATMDWVQRTYELGDFVGIVDGDYCTFIPVIRVKFLDGLDIKQLGWEYSCKLSPIEDSKFYTEVYKKEENVVHYTLELSTEGHVVISGWFMDNIYSPITKTLFRGIIKNKSELKKLMKQLGIQ